MRFDVIVIGGGRSGFREAMAALGSGRSCALVSEGRSLDKIDYDEFTRAGGMLMLGDSVISAEISGRKVLSVRTAKLGSTVLAADSFVLATGRFFSCGLAADMDSVRETVFGLDLDFPAERGKWFDDDFFARQPFMNSGVVTDRDRHPSIAGKRIENLIVTGSILSKN